MNFTKRLILLFLFPLFLISCDKKPDLEYLDACAHPDALKEIKYYVKHKISNAAGLSIAASENTNVKILKELLKSKNISDSDKLDALWNALDNKNPEVFNVLVKATDGANSFVEKTGKTIFMEACTKGRADMVNVLIKNGADVTARDKRGNCALGYALDSENKNQELISVLGKANAYIKPELKMVSIPDKNIEMMSTEVTQEIYTTLKLNPSKYVGANFPVDSVTWYDAVDFCNILSQIQGFTPVYSIDGKRITKNDSADGFRLPTDEEWKYAAKGGTNNKYAGSNDIKEVAWFRKTSDETTHPVAQKKPNGYRLYDMSGNVWEWCWDLYPGCRNVRIIRGGSWSSYDYDCLVDSWDGYDEDNTRINIGFRIVRDIK